MARINLNGCVCRGYQSYSSTKLCTESEYGNTVTIRYYAHVILCNIMKTSSYDSFKAF